MSIPIHRQQRITCQEILTTMSTKWERSINIKRSIIAQETGTVKTKI